MTSHDRARELVNGLYARWTPNAADYDPGTAAVIAQALAAEYRRGLEDAARVVDEAASQSKCCSWKLTAAAEVIRSKGARP